MSGQWEGSRRRARLHGGQGPARTHQGWGQGGVAEAQPESEACGQRSPCLELLLPIAEFNRLTLVVFTLYNV